ncbi:hypothetical protein ACFY2W_32790 [Streptomyces sp. NPDC001262]|uniref:hypothetical protein n=1 Tax=Streptomyces sp. NPDC001262 TaxID=3364552 RepID=UPI003673939A
MTTTSGEETAAAAQEAEKALRTLSRYPAALLEANKAIGGVRFGPYKIIVKCGSCHECIFGRMATVKQPTQLLSSVITATANRNLAFLKDFTIFRNWLAKSVPAITPRFATAEREIAELLKRIKDGSGVEKQKARVKAALLDIHGGMENSKETIKPVISATARLHLENEAALKKVLEIRSSLSIPFDKVWQELLKMYNEERVRCGESALRQKFDEMRTSYTASVEKVGSTIDGIKTRTVGANNGLAVITGTLVNFTNALNSALKHLDQAGKEKNWDGVVFRLNFVQSKGAWDRFARAAKDLFPVLDDTYAVAAAAPVAA